jgi:hypothetical protein
MFWLIEVTIPGGLARAIHGGFSFANLLMDVLTIFVL